MVRTEDELELAGIQLLPSEQSAGIGSRIIADLFAEATAAGKPMTLSVEKDNERARLLYERLGFTATGQTDEEFVMRRVPLAPSCSAICSAVHSAKPARYSASSKSGGSRPWSRVASITTSVRKSMSAAVAARSRYMPR